MPTPAIPPDKQAMICKLYASGVDYVTITQAAGISRSSILNVVRKHGIQRRQGKVIDEALRRRICTLYDRGMDPRDIAPLVQVGRSSVYNIVREAGLRHTPARLSPILVGHLYLKGMPFRTMVEIIYKETGIRYSKSTLWSVLYRARRDGLMSKGNRNERRDIAKSIPRKLLLLAIEEIPSGNGERAVWKKRALWLEKQTGKYWKPASIERAVRRIKEKELGNEV